MIQILVVDDDVSKLNDIAAFLAAVDNEISVNMAGSAADALSLCSAKQFDIAIVDLVLPAMAESEPLATGGLDLLRALSRIETDDKLGRKRPRILVGVTAHFQLDTLIERRCATYGAVLLRYAQGDETWKEGLAAVVKSVSVRDSSVPAHESLACIICALEDPEAAAVRALPLGWQRVNQSPLVGDYSGYWEGTLPGSGERSLGRVILASSTRMGVSAATALATKMSIAFKPRLLVMPGITAGKRGPANIGDVLCADPVFEWGTGKWAVQEDGTEILESAPYQLSLDDRLRKLIEPDVADVNSLSDEWARWAGARPADQARVRRVVVASGLSVVAAPNIFKTILSAQRKAVGVDMEAFGVYLAADESPLPKPRAVSLKSVVDFGDAHKSDDFQAQAAKVSAEYTLRFLSRFARSPLAW